MLTFYHKWAGSHWVLTAGGTMARRPFLISFSLYFLSRFSSPLLKPKGSNTPPAAA